MDIRQSGFHPSGLLDLERVLLAAGLLRTVRLIFTNLTEATGLQYEGSDLLLRERLRSKYAGIVMNAVNNSVKTQLWLLVPQNNRSFPVKGNLRCFLHTIAGESRPHLGLFSYNLILLPP